MHAVFFHGSFQPNKPAGQKKEILRKNFAFNIHRIFAEIAAILFFFYFADAMAKATATNIA